MGDAAAAKDVVRIRCAGCGVKLRLPAERDPSTLRCPKCGAPVKPALNPGTVIGEFTVQKPIAKGGMGEVFLAIDANGAAVALKVMHPDMSRNKEMVARFRREGRVGALIDHPAAVACFACDRQEQCWYMAMELVTGGEVGRLIKKKGPLGWKVGLDYGVKLADLLATMTRTGVVHRDIKPSNIMLDDQGQPKLADFGLAKMVGDREEDEDASLVNLTMTGSQLGTPAYMPPEQIEDAARAAEAADVYSLGATIYTIIGGERPFPGKGAVEVMEAVLHRHPPRITKHCPDCPPALAELLDWCMAKSPTDRPRDGIELLRLFEKVQADPQNSQAILDQRVVNNRRANSATGLVVIIVVLVLAGLIGGYFLIS